ncbi:MAG TPA: hypothetical protein DEG10_02970 [Leclercia adecarboxylata]|nr:hypothetical protein [Leclercia adecarboxylata]
MNTNDIPRLKKIKTPGSTERKRLKNIIWLLTCIIIGLIIYTLSDKIVFNSEGFLFSILGNVKYAVAVSALGVIGTILITYVNKDIGSVRSDIDKLDQLFDLRNEVNSLKSKVDELAQFGSNEIQKIVLEPIEKTELIESAKKRIIGNTLLLADASLKDEINSLRHQVDINQHYSDIVYRLENEIARLNRRGGVNLVIGAIIALVGILYLGYTVTNQVAMNDKLDYILHMAPRLSFVIVIELFAYFFLKLYKNGFDEVKYFQNELTNVDSKVLGIKFLKDVRNEELMSEVIKSLMATERNFILEKGQSTVSLEQQKLKSAEGKNVSEVLKEITKIRR